MPVQGNALKGVPSENRLGLGLLLGRNRVNAFSQHPLSLQTLLSSICETDDGIVAKRGQPLSPIRFHIPEAPAFAAIGVNEEVKTVTVEKLVWRLVGLAERHAVSVRGAVVRAIRVNSFIDSTLSQTLPLNRLAAVGFRRNAITKKPARRRVYRGSRYFGSLRWNLNWCRR